MDRLQSRHANGWMHHLGYLALIAAFGLALSVLGGCAGKRSADVQHYSSDKLLSSAKHMVRMDNFREFDRAEFQFLALRVFKTEDVQLSGWLAQLYICWAEQLKSEVDFMRLKMAALRAADNEKELAALSNMVNYRLVQLDEVLESARRLSNTLRRYYPKEYITHRVLADYYRVMGDFEQATDQVMLVKALNPDSVGLRFLQGALKAQKDKDFIKAIEDYDQAIKLDPLFIKAIYFKALAYHEMGHKEKAKEAMLEVLKNSPEHPGARAFLAADDYLKTLTTEAMKNLKYARSERIQQPKEPHLIYWLARMGRIQPASALSPGRA